MTDIDALQAKLGLPPAPVVRAGLATVVQFFRSVLNEDPLQWWEYIRGIDFHNSVRIETLPPKTRLSQHESLGSRREKPFTYYTTPGTSPTATGTTFPHVRYRLFETTRPTVALISTASPMHFNDVARGEFDRVSRMGGGTQYIIATRDAPAPVRAGAR